MRNIIFNFDALGIDFYNPESVTKRLAGVHDIDLFLVRNVSFTDAPGLLRVAESFKRQRGRRGRGRLDRKLRHRGRGAWVHARSFELKRVAIELEERTRLNLVEQIQPDLGIVARELIVCTRCF